jgi:outer membrane protein OmpA-like peptidoglycan-associated protein
MASLLAVFVLLFVATQNKRIGDVTAQAQKLVKALQGQLAQAGVDTGAVRSDPRDPYTVLVVFPDSLLFERDSSHMLSSGRRLVQSATPRVVNVLCADSFRPSIDQVVVEGHTDSTIPRKGTPESGRRYNLKLSQLRSMDFVSVSTEALTNSADLSCYLALVSASGRGQEAPLPGIAPDSAPQRRVLLRIRLRSDVKDTV